MPSYLDRLRGECRKIFLNSSSVNASQSFVVKLRIAGIGVNSTVLLGLEKRFQGQTSWHTSHPNIQLSKRLCMFSGINISFSSIVKYEIHLLPSTTPGETIASVGQASMHLVQVPQ